MCISSSRETTNIMKPDIIKNTAKGGEKRELISSAALMSYFVLMENKIIFEKSDKGKCSIVVIGCCISNTMLSPDSKLIIHLWFIVACEKFRIIASNIVTITKHVHTIFVYDEKNGKRALQVGQLIPGRMRQIHPVRSLLKYYLTATISILQLHRITLSKGSHITVIALTHRITYQMAVSAACRRHL